jgi:hypothetical protein
VCAATCRVSAVSGDLTNSDNDLSDVERHLVSFFVNPSEERHVMARSERRLREAMVGARTPTRLWGTNTRTALVAAAAAVLVLAGVGVRLASQALPRVAQHSPAPSGELAFGKLPEPALHPLVGGGGATTPTVVPYFGPATMTWSGQLPAVPSSAPVSRFKLPGAADADAFAARLGGRLASSAPPSEPRMYRLASGWLMSIRFEDPVAGEPTFYMNRDLAPSGTQPLGETKARAAADAELARLGLTPSWKFAVSVSTVPPLIHQEPLYVVQYQRLIDVSTTLTAGEVDGNADPAGINVVIDSSGTALQLTGSFRLAEQRARYVLRAPSSTINDAVNAPPSIGLGPAPTLKLTRATLVYTVVTSDKFVYLEPAYLFTGTFIEKGTLEKRVLVPAVAATGLSG